MRRDLFLSILLFVFLLPPSFAVETAGVSPDNPILWHLDLFMEKFGIAITSSPSVKVEKILAAAQERAAEFDKMLRWKKIEEAKKAKDAHLLLLEKAQETVISLEKKNTQKEFDEILAIEKTVYEHSVAQVALQSTFPTEDDDQKTLVAEIMEAEDIILQKLTTEVQLKKEAIKLKLKAAGLTESEIVALEQADVVSDANKTALTGAVSAITDISVPESVIETVDAVTDVGETAAETITESIQTIDSVSDAVEKVSTIVTDTTTSRVKIDGDVTAEQLQRINILYEQLRAENTDAEIELTVSRMDNGLWKIEKEIDGILTSLQQEQLDDLLLTLSNAPSTVKIKIKYDPGDVATGTGVVVGESDAGLETAFVIG